MKLEESAKRDWVLPGFKDIRTLFDKWEIKLSFQDLHRDVPTRLICFKTQFEKTKLMVCEKTWNVKFNRDTFSAILLAFM